MGSGRGHGLCSVRLVPLQVHTFSWLSTLQRSSLAFVVAKEGGDGDGNGGCGLAYATNNLILCCIQKGCATRSKPETRQPDGQTKQASQANETKQRDERQRKCHFTACLTEKWTLSCEYDDGEDEEMTRWCCMMMMIMTMATTRATSNKQTEILRIRRLGQRKIAGNEVEL